jgi:hypothetical protein
MKVKRIGPKSLGKVLGLTYAFFGFLGGLFFLLISLISQNGADATNAPPPIVFGLIAPIAFLLLYGIFGFVGGVISAWIYNVAAKRIGGIEIDTE